MFARSPRRWVAFIMPAFLSTLAGCSSVDTAAPGRAASSTAVQSSSAAPAPGPSSTSLSSAPPRVGVDALSPAVRGKTVLVVGDSWAGYFGDGMSKVASEKNVIVNAGLGGCGIMLPDWIAGKKPPQACLEWPVKWPEYMNKYQPDAVLLRTGNWDVVPQEFDGKGVELTIEHPLFRQRFERNMDLAISILTKNGTPVYLTNMVNAKGGWNKLTKTMNREVQEIAEKYKDKGVHLLDLNAELCNANGCPETLQGHALYDETHHPADWSRDRLSKWILNSMFTR